MIPSRVKQIAVATALLGAVALVCFLGVNQGAGIAFGATTAWMLANLFVWTVLMKLVLQPGDQKPGAGIALAAVFAKLGLLFGGIFALRDFAPYDRMQVWAIVAGISSVLLVTFLKAAGAKISAAIKTPESVVSEKKAAKV